MRGERVWEELDTNFGGCFSNQYDGVGLEWVTAFTSSDGSEEAPHFVLLIALFVTQLKERSTGIHAHPFSHPFVNFTFTTSGTFYFLYSFSITTICFNIFSCLAIKIWSLMCFYIVRVIYNKHAPLVVYIC